MKGYVTGMLLYALIVYAVYPAYSVINDACHGSYPKQTINVLKCALNESICISKVLYYQWHIGDADCPHTINRPVVTRCCRHDNNKCNWQADTDTVIKLQDGCESARRKDGSCKLASRTPAIARWRCYIDNIDFSTSSSVRSIHYTCQQGACPGILSPPSRAIVISNRKYSGQPARTTQPALMSTTTGTTTTLTEVTSLAKAASTLTGSVGYENLSTRQPVVTDANDVIRVTSRMLSPPEISHSDPGAIAGGIIGTVLICLLILAAVLYRRWSSRHSSMTSKVCGEVAGSSGVSQVKTRSTRNKAGHRNSVSSVWTTDSFDSVETCRSSAKLQPSRGGSLKSPARVVHEYACLVKSGTVFRDVPPRTIGQSHKRDSYDHVHGNPPELSVFRYHEYDHLTLPEGHYDSPRPLKVSPEPSSPSSETAEKKCVYDHLRKASVNKRGDEKRYDLLERNWNE